MGYSESIKTLEERLPYLEKLRRGEGDRWLLAPGVKVSNFAYKIREALHLGHMYREIYPELANAPDRFRVEIVDQRTVQAVPRPEASPFIEATGLPRTQTQGLAHGELAPPKVEGPQTAASIIQHWHNMQPSTTPMVFPHARLSVEELGSLYSWAMSRTPQWSIFVGIDGQLTLRRRTITDAGISWEPGDEA